MARTWKSISTDDAYHLSQAEFRGTTIQALQDIREDIRELKQEHSITRYISLFIAGLSGLISGMITPHFIH